LNNLINTLLDFLHKVMLGTLNMRSTTFRQNPTRGRMFLCNLLDVGCGASLAVITAKAAEISTKLRFQPPEENDMVPSSWPLLR